MRSAALPLLLARCAARAGLQVGVQVVLRSECRVPRAVKPKLTPPRCTPIHPVFRQGLALPQNTQAGGLRWQTVGQIRVGTEWPVQLHLSHASELVARRLTTLALVRQREGVVYQLIAARPKALCTGR